MLTEDLVAWCLTSVKMPSMVGPSHLAVLLNVLCLVPSLRCFLRIAAGCQSCYCASQLGLMLTFIISSEPVSEPISLQVLPRAVSCTTELFQS